MSPRYTNYPHAVLTSTGRVREHNEDAVLAYPPLYVVADGLGGHEAGEVASNLAIQVIQGHAPKHPDSTGLMRSVQKANNAILKAVREGVGNPGMGTTLTAAIIRDGKIALAQVGDSRAYLLRSGRLAQVTEDHSVVAAMRRSGSISEAEARNHPQRNVITRALGSDNNLVVDTYEFDTTRGDRWLLCSDGLHGVLADEIIAEILLENQDPRQCCEELVRIANEAGGPDNISCIVVDIDSESIRPQEKLKTSFANLRFFFGSVLLIALVLAGVLMGLMTYAKNRSYLAVSPRGYVSVYAGVPDSILGQTYSRLSTESTIAIDSLPLLEQRPIISKELSFDSLRAAEMELKRLETVAIPPEPLNVQAPSETEPIEELQLDVPEGTAPSAQSGN